MSSSFRTYSPSYDELLEYFWSHFANLERPKSESLRGLTVELTLSAEEAKRGGSVRIMVPARVCCPTCRGSGGIGGWGCRRCRSVGAIEDELPLELVFPEQVSDGHAVEVALDGLGIRNCYLIVLFRVSAEAGGGG
jgi:DnaJ-class molecular chaperone